MASEADFCPTCDATREDSEILACCSLPFPSLFTNRSPFQPQRPLRALRVRDENMPVVPSGAPGKTIHQRNKSTPALSTLAQAGALKPAAKRTAFADVSNTTRNAPAKDDSLPTKAGIELKKDFGLAPIQETSKAAGGALLRPAQRPVQIAASKPAPVAADSVPKSTSDEASVIAHPRKLNAKRSTAVFKEQSTIAEAKSTATADDDAYPVNKAAPAPSVALAEIPSDTTVDALQQDDSPSEASSEALPTYEPVEVQGHVEILEEQAQVLEREQIENFDVKNVVELEKFEEYWDEDEDEEFYDADGYTGHTTARELKSRGDNTTGGVTVVLAPRVTARTRRELEAARQYVEEHKTPEDVDDEQWDTSMVAEYGEEIFEYMRDLEERMKPNPFYMDNQAEIQWSMRSVLMDWLVQVHHRFTLLPETLFLAVNYVDRFLSCKVVSLGKLQLVGATAIFVAAKYEEINCPSVSEIVYMVDGGYTVDEILKAERFMLSMLQFELGWPGPMSFLRRISKADDYDLETRTLAKYFLEITIMDERFVGCAPSFVAAGAHCLSRLMLKKGDWSLAHVHYSGYTYAQLRNLVAVMLECSENPQKHHSAVYEKYADKRYKKASHFVEGEIRKGFVLPSVSRESMGAIGYPATVGSWRRK
ncbi:hypothetical protein K490DRAFT_42060 [Saccharata proteae CBS 121410]|uniref:Cyclin N-terminal domain-containing protein n=1 Tax=Saccharata proteae CBS 121410 TaxID=1314787 RepID=A0A9P4LWW0_9PEZI|nr:hypothetical protein K490DRAFT_42060 [Saccharata proteae CBS 121410]